MSQNLGAHLRDSNSTLPLQSGCAQCSADDSLGNLHSHLWNITSGGGTSRTWPAACAVSETLQRVRQWFSPYVTLAHEAHEPRIIQP